MLDLSKFLQNLKNLGFKISMSEVLDANRFLLEAENIVELRFGLMMIVAKSKQEQDLFDLVWENLLELDFKKRDDTQQEIDQSSVTPNNLSNSANLIQREN